MHVSVCDQPQVEAKVPAGNAVKIDVLRAFPGAEGAQPITIAFTIASQDADTRMSSVPGSP